MTTRISSGFTSPKCSGEMRDRNGYELNTACTIAALLHGEGDFARTLELAFSLGWDCDNNAATAGTILGVVKGYCRMPAQGWRIVDRYRNEARGHMPEDEIIMSFADRLINLAEKVIVEQRGQRVREAGQLRYGIQSESPRNVAPLLERAELLSRMRESLDPQVAVRVGSAAA